VDWNVRMTGWLLDIMKYLTCFRYEISVYGSKCMILLQSMHTNCF